MDTLAWPSGSEGYDVTPSGSPDIIGRIWVHGGGAIVEPRTGSPLVGIGLGPHPSRASAMESIGRYLEGECRLAEPRRR
jgi:hypothetical protein